MSVDVKQVLSPVRSGGGLDWTKIGTAAAVGAAAYLVFLGVASAKTTDNDHTGETVPPSSPAGQAVQQQAKTRAQAGALGERAVAALSRHVGEHGRGKKGTSGYHRSDLIDAINLGVYGDGKSLLGEPWCARAVRWAYETAARELGLPPPFAKVKSTLASVSTWAKQFKGYKLDAPKVGTAALKKDLSHAMLVAQVDGQSIVSCEGNHGDAVANVRRSVSDLLFYDIERYAKDQADGERVAGYVLGTLALIGAC